MNAKDRARREFDLMADESTLDEVIQAMHLAAEFERGENQIRRGQVIAHEAAREMFSEARRRADPDFPPSRQQPETDQTRKRLP